MIIDVSWHTRRQLGACIVDLAKELRTNAGKDISCYGKLTPEAERYIKETQKQNILDAEALEAFAKAIRKEEFEE